MRVLITGACGFVGASLALALRDELTPATITGLDNLWRPGSETNRSRLRAAGVRIIHGDVRCASDFEALPAVDWVIDAAANASVLAGVDGATSPRQLVEHNLSGTANILEFCRSRGAGLILLSTSRVYSVAALSAIPLTVERDRFRLSSDAAMSGLTEKGIAEAFPVGPPASLYGTTKLASEQLAIEYGAAFDLPIWINRCGVVAGAGQFGQPAQGIFSWWIHRWRNRQPLSYLGFDGRGLQVRDCLHPADLAAVVVRQLKDYGRVGEARTVNVGGGIANSMSLAQLSAWCADRLGPHTVKSDGAERRYDVPWVVLDAAMASRRWEWMPSHALPAILEEIVDHAESHPHWLAISEG